MEKRPLIIIGLLLFALIISTLVWGARYHHETCPECFMRPFNMEVIRHYIQSFGPWAIVVYIILYIMNTITLIPPIAFMSLSAGALFGPVWGTVALTLGSFCGTTATFVISRFIGGEFVEEHVSGRGAEFNQKLGQNGFLVLLPIRLIGFPPYEFVNYACGLSKIKYKDYIAATMIGMSPAIIIQVLLADRLANFSWKDPILYVAAILFIAMVVITGQIIKKKKQEKENGVISPTKIQ